MFCGAVRKLQHIAKARNHNVFFDHSGIQLEISNKVRFSTVCGNKNGSE